MVRRFFFSGIRFVQAIYQEGEGWYFGSVCLLCSSALIRGDFDVNDGMFLRQFYVNYQGRGEFICAPLKDWDCGGYVRRILVLHGFLCEDDRGLVYRGDDGFQF